MLPSPLTLQNASSSSDVCALKEGFPQKLLLSLEKVSDLRYGENPHQRAALLSRELRHYNGVCADAVQLQGKELSFNN